MKKVKVGKLVKNIFMMLVIGCILCGSVMTVNAQNTSANIEAGSTEIVQEIPEGAVVIETEEVSETLPVTEAVSGTYMDLSWTIENDTLTITGSGAMEDAKVYNSTNNYYTLSYSNYPWSPYSYKKLVIGEGITNISQFAFNCPELESVSLATTVTTIGAYAFNNCKALESFIIPNTVTTIAYNAFSDSGLKKIEIPRNVKILGTSAFEGCTELKTAKINGAFIEILSDTFKDCTSLTTVTLRSDAQYNIGKRAFENCDSLSDLSWLSDVSTIGQCAFLGCDGIEVLSMPDTVSSIHSEAFANCSQLKKVIVGYNLISIGEAAFSGCPIEEFVVDNEMVSYVEQIFSQEAEALTIYGWLESSTEDYAKENGYTFKAFTPSLTKVTAESKGIHVYWEAFPRETTYEVYRSTSKTSGYTLIKSGVEGTDYLDTTVKSGTTYYYKIVAVRNRNRYIVVYTVKSGFSNASDAITYLAAPTFKKIVNVVSGVHVYWNASTGAKTYSVYRSTKKDSGYQLVKSGLTATHYIDTTAKSGTTYYYKIIALNGSVKSAYSKPFNAITYVGTPDITSRFNKGAGVQLGWNKIEGATGYAIYRKPFEGSTWTRVTTIEGNKTFTWMDESVKTNNGTVYKYTIRALAGSDMKTLSGCRSTGRTMARLTSRTLNSAVKASATSIKCNWTTTSVCNGYEVRFMVGDKVYNTYTVGNYKTGVKTFTGLKAGQTYKIQVRSYKKVDGVGTFYSAWSTAKTVRL